MNNSSPFLFSVTLNLASLTTNKISDVTLPSSVVELSNPGNQIIWKFRMTFCGSYLAVVRSRIVDAVNREEMFHCSGALRPLSFGRF